MQATDEIVTRVLHGDVDAYAGLIRLYQAEVWRVIAAMLLDRAKTEDLVQQTFLNAYRHLNRFQQGRDFGAWIKEIARNQARQELRSRQRESSRMELYHQHFLTLAEDPVAAEATTSMAEALRECIKKLPAAAAEIAQLRYGQALDFSRIATLLGRTVEATRQQLSRIRLVLRDCVQKRLAQPWCCFRNVV